jgi:hypothetical protein
LTQIRTRRFPFSAFVDGRGTAARLAAGQAALISVDDSLTGHDHESQFWTPTHSMSPCPVSTFAAATPS